MAADGCRRKEQERVSIELSQLLVAFVCEQLNVSPLPLTATTRLLQDLGVDGDDGVELIHEFSLRFGVDLAGFDPSIHFGPEAGGNPLIWIWWIVSRRWPKCVPITLADLELSLRRRRWVSPTHAVV